MQSGAVNKLLLCLQRHLLCCFDCTFPDNSQSALIIDMLRSHAILFDLPEYEGKIEDVIFVGHSLGGACAIIAAAKLQAS